MLKLILLVLSLPVGQIPTLVGIKHITDVPEPMIEIEAEDFIKKQGRGCYAVAKRRLVMMQSALDQILSTTAADLVINSQFR